MDPNERRTPGQAMIERMEARQRRRPRIGMTPAFYTRLGLDDPWALEGVPTDSEGKSDGMVFLSASPYYAMLRKLANARKRRERRQAKFLERRAGTTLKAASRVWPGERTGTPVGVGLSRVASLAMGDMKLPERAVVPAPASVAESVVVAGEAPRRRNEATPSVANPWNITPFSPARVVRTAASSVRPMDRAGERIIRAQSEEKDDQVLGSLRQSTRARVVRARDEIQLVESAPVEVVRIVRRANVARPVVRQVEEFALQSGVGLSTAARPSFVAPTQGAASRRLRPVVLSSPAMAMAMAEHQYTVDVDRAVAGALAVPERGETMRPAAARRIPATQRVIARAQSGSSAIGATLSASPVSSSRTASSARPVASSPVARSSARDGGGGGSGAWGPSSASNSTIRSAIGSVRASEAAFTRLLAAESAVAADTQVSASEAPSRRVGLVRDASGAVRRSVAASAVGETAGVERAVSRISAAARAVPDALLPNAQAAAVRSDAGPASRPVETQARDSVQALPTPTQQSTVQSAAPSVRAALRAETATPTASSVPRPVAAFARAEPAQPTGVVSAAASIPPAYVRSGTAVETETSGFVPARMSAVGAGGRAAAPAVGRAAALAGRVPEMSAVTPISANPAGAGRAAALAGRVPEMSAITPISANPASGAGRDLPAPVAGVAPLAVATQAAARTSGLSSTPASVEGVSLPTPRATRRAQKLATTGVKWAAQRLASPDSERVAGDRSVVPRAVPALAPTNVPSRRRAYTIAAGALGADARGELDSVGELTPGLSTGRRVSETLVRPGSSRVPAQVAPQTLLATPESAGTRASLTAASREEAAPVASATRAPEAVALSQQSPRQSAVVAAAARDLSPAARRVESVSPSVPAASQKRTGPLSWAQAERSPGLVASFVARSRPAVGRAVPVARSAVSGPPPADIRVSRAPAPVLTIASATTKGALAELTEAGLVSSTFSPNTPVRTPDGRYISARVASALPGLAILPAANGPVAVANQAPVGRTASFRAPEVRFLGNAASAAGAPSAGAGAAPRKSQSEWVSARSAVSQSTAYRGAISTRAPETDFFGASIVTTPAGEFIGARIATATERSRRAAAAAPTPTMFGEPVLAPTLPAAVPASRASGATLAPAQPTASVAGITPAAPRARRGLDSTLIDSATGIPLSSDAPVWAARSEGAPLVRSAQGLFDSLARATSAEQVVQVIAARAGGFEGAVPLTEPMREVVQAIRNEMAAAPELVHPVQLATRAPDVETPRATVLRGTRVSPVASSAIASRGSVRPVRSSAVSKSAGGADDRVSKLVRRLTDLIHLAETERRLSEAQAQVRMAEDSAAARAEGSAPLGQSGGGGPKLDIETFTREALETVNRELELRRERRTEDGDESNWW